MRKKSIILSIYLSIHLRDLRPRRRGALALSAADLWSARVGRGGGCALPHTIPAARRGELARVATQGCPPLFRALRSPSQLAGGLLLASVGAPALPAAEARFAERTDWLARPRPTPGGRRAASIAQSTRLLLSSDLVAYCGSLVAYG